MSLIESELVMKQELHSPQSLLNELRARRRSPKCVHQEHYWWPNSKASGDCAIFGYRFPLRGSSVRYYLWLQIFAGWLLSAIFVAGITGVIEK